jgi:hypothetical protein
MQLDPLEYVEISYFAWMLCKRIGAPTTSGHVMHYVPRWAKNLVDAFGTESDGAWNTVLVGVGARGEDALRRLVQWVTHNEAYDLAEVHAALRLGGPQAALQLADTEDAQDGAT